MSKEFEPYNKEQKDNGFNTWDYKGVKGDGVPEITKEQQFLNECESLRQEAINKGYAEGMEQAKTEIENKKAELVTWIKLMQNPVQLLDDKLTQEMIETVVWLSQHCIGIELSVSPEKLRDLFNRIKEELPSLLGEKTFAMHPDDVNWVKAEIGVSEVPGLYEILVADPTLSRGDFYLKSEHSELDGRLHTRLITLFAKYIDKDNLIVPIQSPD